MGASTRLEARGLGGFRGAVTHVGCFVLFSMDIACPWLHVPPPVVLVTLYSFLLRFAFSTKAPVRLGLGRFRGARLEPVSS